MAFPSGAPQSLRRLFNYLSARASSMGEGVSATIALAAGANNVMGVTIQVTDEAGIAVAGYHQIDVWASESATGSGLTADTYSGDLVATAGVILASLTAKKRWTVITNSAGLFTGNLTDSAEPQDQYIACKAPSGGKVIVSAISASKFG